MSGRYALAGSASLALRLLGLPTTWVRTRPFLAMTSADLAENAALISANGNKIDALRLEMIEQFDRLSSRVDLDQTDLKKCWWPRAWLRTMTCFTHR